MGKLVKAHWYKLVMFLVMFALLATAIVANIDTANAFVEPPATVKTQEEAKAQGDKISEDIMEEGIVLLKNGETTPALPMKSGAKVTVFGKTSTRMVFGVGGSSGAPGGSANYNHLYQALRSEGFDVNPTMESFYMDDALSMGGRPGLSGVGANGMDTALPTGETPWNYYEPTQKDTFENYSDAAIVVLARQGGEGWDLPRISTGGRTYQEANGGSGNTFGFWGGRPDLREAEVHPGSGRTLDKSEKINRRNDNYLRLDVHEEEMLKQIKASGKFDRTIVLLNTGNMMELGFIEDYATYGIDGALMIGHPGTNSTDSESQINRLKPIARILNGDVNPSGRLADIAPKDHTKDPTWFNFGTGYQFTESYANLLNTAPTSASQNTSVDNDFYTNEAGINAGNTQHVEYREGIYFGYRYYETRAFEESKDGNADWYQDNVVYPFGYGLSYTNFDKEIVGKTAYIAKDGNVSFDIKVTNTGDRAGKEVLQLYYSAPYVKGGIEKSHVVMGAFEKTKLIAPGGSQTIKLSMPVKELASWDQYGVAGYVLDSGDYDFYIGSGSNLWADDNTLTATYNVNKSMRYNESETGTAYSQLFQEETDFMHGGLESLGLFSDEERNGEDIVMTRADFAGTFPIAPDEKNKMLTSDGVAFMNENYIPGSSGNVNGNTGSTDATMQVFDAGKPWETDEMPAMNVVPEDGYITIHDMTQVPYDDERWDAFMDQWTFADMRDITAYGGFSIGRGSTGASGTAQKYGILNNETPDGPFGFSRHTGNQTNGNLGVTIGVSNCSYPSPVVVAQTFNVDLAYEQGIAIGDEGQLHGGFSGIYEPAMNMHRSPFGGRNSEYYAEDVVLTGKIAAEHVRGLRERGVVGMMKHFFMNDQETHRDAGRGLITWADEQTIRLYGESWRYVVQEGGTMGAMSSFARIGKTWVGVNYNVLTSLLRDEWGFRGVVVTDWWGGSGMGTSASNNRNYNVRAGNDLPLNGNVAVTNLVTNPTHVAAVRFAAKNTCYALANSCASIFYASDLEQNLVVGKQAAIDVMPRLSEYRSSSASPGTSAPSMTNRWTAGRGTADGGLRAFTYDTDNTVASSYQVSGIANLPAGLSFDSVTGKITGSPTVATTEPVEISITVSNFTTNTRNLQGSSARTLARLSTNTFKINVAASETITPPEEGEVIGTSQLDTPSAKVSGTTLSWSTVLNAKGYEVRTSENATPVSVSGTSYDVSALTAGSHTLQVRALGTTGETTDSAWANIAYNVSGTLAAPVAKIVGTSVFWDAVANATSYEIIIGEDKPVIVTGTAYSLSALEKGTYSIKVRAISTSEIFADSDWSSVSYDTPKSGGCGSSIAAGSFVILLGGILVFGGIVLFLRKKKQS